MSKKEETSFPIRHDITILPADDPNRRKICPPMYFDESPLVRIFPKDDDNPTRYL